MWTFDGCGAPRARAYIPGLTTRAVAPILAALIGCVVWCLAPTAGRAAGRLYQVREIKPRLFVWMPDDVIEAEGDPQYTRAGNAGFIVADQGVVVIDTTNTPFHAREVLYEIRKRTEEPVWYVINTGSAGDEMLGNEVFGDLRAVILSTAKIQSEIRDRAASLAAQQRGNGELQRRWRGIHITPPDRTFEGRMELPVAPLTVQLIALDLGVNGVAVYLPQLRIAFLGDLFQNGYFPRLESRDIHGWIEALRKAEAWDAEVYVPGHGEPAGREQLQQFRQFLEWLNNQVETRIKQGKSLERTELDLLPFKGYSWRAPEQATALLVDVYHQLAGQSVPSAVSGKTSAPPKP